MIVTRIEDYDRLVTSQCHECSQQNLIAFNRKTPSLGSYVIELGSAILCLCPACLESLKAQLCEVSCNTSQESAS